MHEAWQSEQLILYTAFLRYALYVWYSGCGRNHTIHKGHIDEATRFVVFIDSLEVVKGAWTRLIRKLLILLSAYYLR